MGVKAKDCSGQMTVEFAVAFPVMIIVALIAMNAILFFSECAAFDRVTKEAVRIYASSPTYGQSLEQSTSLIEQEISKHFEKEYLSATVTCSREALGRTKFVATLSFSPTLFGMGLRSEIFGVNLAQIKHSATFAIDSYKPGVLL